MPFWIKTRRLGTYIHSRASVDLMSPECIEKNIIMSRKCEKIPCSEGPFKKQSFCFRWLWAAAMLLVCAGLNAAEKPNVLFISVDDLNDWVGTLEGHPQAVTPNLDRLAKRGVYFTNAHCSTPVCNSSRHSLLSGLHPANSGWYGSVPLSSIERSYDATFDGRVPMPTHFKNNGYVTLAAGKIFHKGVQDFDYPYWDITRPSHYGFRKGAFSRSKFAPYPPDGGYFHQKYKEKISGRTLCWGALEDSEMPPKGMPDEQIADWAVEQLGQSFDKPFFMAVGFLRPHVPYTAPKRYFDLYSLDDIEMPVVPNDEFNDIPIYGKAMAYGTLPGGDHQEVLDAGPDYWKELVLAYLACVSFVDDQIGEVLDALDASEHADNTVIVLWSDHGQHLGEKKHWRKQCLWEEATRVPMFISYPNMNTTNQVCDSPVSLIDIYPTLSTLCGLPKQDLDGVDLQAVLEDPKAERGRPVLTTRYYKNHAVRSQDWRYIQYRDGTEELYDHRSDPGEHTNLASNPEYADILVEHRQWLPKQDAFPAGKKSFTGDRYDDKVEQFRAEGVPTWLQ